MSFVPVLVVTLIASTFGDWFWYWLGRTRGVRVLKFLCRVALEPDHCVRHTQNAFAKRGAALLLYAKFVPGLSAVAHPLAGVEGISASRFLVFNSLGTLIHAAALTSLGYIFSDQLEWLAAQFAAMGTWLVALVAGAFAAYLAWKFFERRRFIRSLRGSRITTAALKEQLDAGADVFVIDLRGRLDFNGAPQIIPGALHIAAEDLDERDAEIPRDRQIILYCSCPNEATSGRAALILKKRGITDVHPLVGGFDGWVQNGFPVERVTI